MVEKTPYQILKTINNIEIRKYPELILAVVEGYPDDTGFGFLFRYISGYNKSQQKISMTVPVITSEKIKMTAPVISQKNSMAFIMPSFYDKNTIPIPLDNNVTIKIQKERILAVLKFGGRTTINKVNKQMNKLLEELKNHNLKKIGNSILMRYNSPFTPGFLRKNEVAVEIRFS
jgi:hypothetical protein